MVVLSAVSYTHLAVPVVGQQILLYRLSVTDHGAELGKLERLAIQADPLLPKQDGPAVGEGDSRRRRQQQWREQHQRQRGHRYIQAALGE